MMNAIPYGRQTIDDDDIQSVISSLKSDFLTQGPTVLNFEKAFAEYVGAKFAVACSNGTAALHLSALALNVKPGKKILCTPITFAASSNAMLYVGAEVEFVDIDPITFLIDIDALETKLKNAPKETYQGIVPVDFTGLPVNTEELKRIANEYNLWIIEDACHAPGGYFTNSSGNQIKCGSGIYSDLTCFSFHPVKHIACGEGGMITTNNENLYQQLIRLRSHGITRDNMPVEKGGWFHEMIDLGFNYRLPDLNCALGLSQLKKADKGIERRIDIANFYFEHLNGVGDITFQTQPKNFQNAWHLFVIQTNRRKELYDFLKTKNIFTQVHYIPVYKHPYYQQLGFNQIACPNAEAYYAKCLSLPMYPGLTELEQNYVVECIKEFYA